jgi:hypothetical protein
LRRRRKIADSHILDHHAREGSAGPSENLLSEGLGSENPQSSGGGRYYLSSNASPAASFNLEKKLQACEPSSLEGAQCQKHLYQKNRISLRHLQLIAASRATE